MKETFKCFVCDCHSSAFHRASPSHHEISYGMFGVSIQKPLWNVPMADADVLAGRLTFLGAPHRLIARHGTTELAESRCCLEDGELPTGINGKDGGVHK